MKEQALALALQFQDPLRRLNALREYLQAFIMRSLHESEAGRAVAFVGGTALRFVVSHYDLPSLFAGKLHALLTRGYPKGRDWYDLIWYRSRRPQVEPNVQLLHNALDQTQGAGTYRASDWRNLLAARLADLDTPRSGSRRAALPGAPRRPALLARPNLEAVLARC